MNELEIITGGYKKQFIEEILQGMSGLIDNSQLMELNKSLNKHTANLTISELPNNIDLNYEETNTNLINNFIKTKKLKGLSFRSINYYEQELNRFKKWLIKSVLEVTTDDLKKYLEWKQKQYSCSNVSLNNVRRILSSFYKYLENEELLIMNPIKAIPSIKEPKRVKKAFTDEEVEKLRQAVSQEHPRNVAIFEVLITSGLRVSELVSLKKDDVSLIDCKGVCLGKGNKQRVFYFSERAKVALITYLEDRNDESPYLFVQRRAPYGMLGVSGVEYMIRQIGKKAGVNKVHPHRFRRTLATRLIRKGMPIDQVSEILGHESLGITQRYIESDRDMLKLTHNKHLN
jgi:site-specific recombinase XerD